MSDATGFLIQFDHEESGYSVIVDDNGRVAYAYILEPSRAIVGDVWLYNRCDTPLEPEWEDKSKLPFANPASFVSNDRQIGPVEDRSEVSVKWQQLPDGDVCAEISIRNDLFAIVAIGSSPGWCVLAAKDGPLAKVLVVDNAGG